MDCGRQICERGGRGRCQRPTVSSVGSVASVLHIPPTEKSPCFFSRFLCELMSACWVKPTEELSVNILPLFCRASCLLASMSNGFDMSLSTSCNPCKETLIKHHIFQHLQIFILVIMMCPPCWMRLHWHVEGRQDCKKLPVRAQHLIWTLIAEGANTEK